MKTVPLVHTLETFLASGFIPWYCSTLNIDSFKQFFSTQGMFYNYETTMNYNFIIKSVIVALVCRLLFCNGALWVKRILGRRGHFLLQYTGHWAKLEARLRNIHV